MSLAACIAQAAADREITREEAADLRARFGAYVEDALGMGHAAGDAERLAGRWLMDDMEADAYTKARRALLSERARQQHLEQGRRFLNRKGQHDLGEYLLGVMELTGRVDTGVKMDTVGGRAYAIEAQAMADLDDLIVNFLGRISTKMRNRDHFDLVIREAFGEATGSPEARALAQAWVEVAERLRKRFNAAGGVIGRLEKWGLPQAHDMRRVFQAGRDHWKDFVRPLLDPQRMRHPNGQRRLTPGELEALLDHVWESIVSAGDVHLAPQARPQGRSFAARHADHRWLIFKSADSWIAYQRRFGEENPLAAVLGHVRIMAKDIAAMELLGPNPQGMLEFLKQWARQQAGLARIGQQSLVPARSPTPIVGRVYEPQNYVKNKIHRLDSMWAGYQGQRETLNWHFADAVDISRDLFTSARLGATSVLAAATDPMFQLNMRLYYRLPTVQMFGGYLRSLDPTNPAHRRAAREAGVALDAALHQHGSLARWYGDVGGRRWSAGLADRVLTVSGLKAVTQAGKDAMGMMLSQELARHRGRAWGALPSRFRELLTTMRIDEADWNVIRQAPPRRLAGVDHISAREVAHIDREVGERLLAGLHETADMATPTASLRASSFFQDTAPGSMRWAVMRSIGYLKTFTLSVHMSHFYRAYELLARGRAWDAARYYGAMIALTTAGGALATQLTDFADLKTPRSMDPRERPGQMFWAEAMIRGGGLGFYGDFLRNVENDWGNRLGETLGGPIVGIGSDALALTAGNVIAQWRGDDPRWGRDFARFAKSYTPGSSLFYARGALDRAVFDQAQKLLDPEADEAFARQMRRWEDETGGGYIVPEGELAPR